MATAPAAAPNALISALRAGTPGLPANAMSTYSFMPNMEPTYGPVTPRAPRAPALMPVAPIGRAPAPSPTPAPVSSAPVAPPVSAPPPPMFVPPVTPLPRIDVVPDDGFVGPMPDDFVGPMPDDFVGPMPDDFVGPMPDDFVGPYGPMPNNQLNPNVTVNDVDVTDTPPPATDPADDFQIDRELGLVQQTDVVNPPPPRVNPPLTPISTSAPRSLTPSVTVNEGLDVTPGPAPYTDPAENFDIDRELGLIQQSDVFMGPTQQAIAEQSVAPNDRLIANVGNVTDVSINPDDFSMYADMLNTDITSTLPAAVPAPAAPEPLTEQDLMEMALFEMMTQQLLTRGAPGMTNEETFER